MSRLAASQLRDGLSEAVNRVAYKGERIILERYGKDLMALVSLEDLQLLERLEDRIDLEHARAALAEADEKGYKDWDELKSELGL